MAGTITTGNFPQAIKPNGGRKTMRKSAKLRDTEPKGTKKPKGAKGAKKPKPGPKARRKPKPSGAGTSAFMNMPK